VNRREQVSLSRVFSKKPFVQFHLIPLMVVKQPVRREHDELPHTGSNFFKLPVNPAFFSPVTLRFQIG